MKKFVDVIKNVKKNEAEHNRRSKRNKIANRIDRELGLIQDAMNQQADTEQYENLANGVVEETNYQQQNKAYIANSYKTIFSTLLALGSAGSSIATIINRNKFGKINTVLNSGSTLDDLYNKEYGQVGIDILGLISPLFKNKILTTFTKRSINSRGLSVRHIKFVIGQDAAESIGAAGDLYGVGKNLLQFNNK